MQNSPNSNSDIIKTNTTFYSSVVTSFVKNPLPSETDFVFVWLENTLAPDVGHWDFSAPAVSE